MEVEIFRWQQRYPCSCLDSAYWCFRQGNSSCAAGPEGLGPIRECPPRRHGAPQQLDGVGVQQVSRAVATPPCFPAMGWAVFRVSDCPAIGVKPSERMP